MNEKVKRFLIYTGIIGSVISAIAYLVVTWVIVMGFESSVDLDKQILFAILGSLTGLMITFFLRNQGITFAKKEEESKKTMEEYYKLINKRKKLKKLHTIKWFMFWSTIKDIFTKGLSLAVSTWFVLYIFMEGSGDFGLFLLAISNIFMFAGFGLVALSKSYDKYIDEHIPVIKTIIEKLKEEMNIKEEFKLADEFIQIIKTKIDQGGSIHSEGEKHANIQRSEVPVASTTGSKEQRRHIVNTV